MRLIRSDDNRYLNPWYNFGSIFDDEDFFSASNNTSGMNMWEDEKSVFVEVAVPGMKEDDLDVQLENGVLTVRGAKQETQEETEDKKKVYSSSMKSSFYYSTTLPSSTGNDVDANLEDGILKLEIAKAEEAKPKKIEVKRRG